MLVKTDEGIDIFCLPDGAMCELCQKSPFDADLCPKTNEYICYPSYCDHYSEQDEIKVEIKIQTEGENQ